MQNNNCSTATNNYSNNSTTHVDDEEYTHDEIMHDTNHDKITVDDGNDDHSSSSSIISCTKSDGHETTTTTRTKRNLSATIASTSATANVATAHPANLEDSHYNQNDHNHHHNINKSGRKGDPRMHKAVAARLANPKLSLYEALVIGGFVYLCSDGGGTDGGTTASTTMDDNLQVDSENVTLAQRKNQLSRRIRLAKQQQQQAEQMKKQRQKHQQQQKQKQQQSQQPQQHQQPEGQQQHEEQHYNNNRTTEPVTQQNEEISMNDEMIDEKVSTTTTTNEPNKSVEEYRSTNVSAGPTTTTTTTNTTTNHNCYEFDHETTNTIAQKLLRNIKTELNEEDFLSSEDEYYGDDEYITGNDNDNNNNNNNNNVTGTNVTSFGGGKMGDLSTGSKAIRKHNNNNQISFPYYGTNEPNRIRAKDHPEYHPIIVIPPVRVSYAPPTLFHQLHTSKKQQPPTQQHQSSHMPSKVFRKNPELQRSVSSASSRGGKTFAKLAQVIGPNALPTGTTNSDAVTDESSHLQQADEDYFFAPGGGKLVNGKSIGKSINHHSYNDNTTTTIPSQTTATNKFTSKIGSKLASLQQDEDDERYCVPPGGGKLVTGKLINIHNTETTTNSKYHGKKYVAGQYINSSIEDYSMNIDTSIDTTITDPNYHIANDNVPLHEFDGSIKPPESLPQATTISATVDTVIASNINGNGIGKVFASDRDTASQNTTSTMDAITSLTQIAAKAGLTLEQFVESLQNGDTASQTFGSTNSNSNNNDDSVADSQCTSYSPSNKACKKRLQMAVALYQSENRALYERCMLLAGYPQSTVGQFDTALASFHTLSPEYIEFIINCWSSEGQRLHTLLKEQQQQQLQQQQVAALAQTGKGAVSKIQKQQQLQTNQIQFYQDQMQNVLQQVRTQVQSQFQQENK